MEFPMRLNKYLAHKGLATRRSADSLISAGKVFVNGTKAVIGQKVEANDTVEVREKTKRFRYLLYYKPRGVITHSPSEGETDIVTRLQDDYGLQGVFPIGRLDKDSEGLIILTDDGRITGRLLDPDHGHEREYAVTVDKKVTGSFLKRLARGVTIERYHTKPARTTAHPRNEHAFRIILTEGKKHQVRRMCAALGYQVLRLKRLRIAHLELGDLKPGQYRKSTPQERAELMKILWLS